MTMTLDGEIAQLRRANAELERRLAEALGREAETAEGLRANEERHLLVTQAVAEGIYDWNIETNALWASPRLIEIFGLTGESLSADDWNERVHRDDFELYRASLRNCFRGVTARLDCEYRVRHGDGEYRWIEDRGVPVRKDNGRAVRLVGAVSDITLRKQAEESLRETHRIKEALLTDLNAVIDTIDYGVCFMGPDLRARVVNRAFRQMWRIPDAFIATGPTVADLINFNRHTGIYDVPEVEFDDFIAHRMKAIQAGDIAPTEMHRADGKILRYAGIVLPDGGRLLTYFDITESKRREAELKETLEYQTAISDVLKVISRSTFDLQPVLDTLVETAVRLCGADMAFIFRRDGEIYRAVAAVGYSPEYVEFRKAHPLISPGRGTLTGRVALERRAVHIPDSASDPEYTLSESISLGKIRTQLGVPLLREGTLIGTINLHRQRVEPFTERQIELVRTFADQAVIAVENARLINETREALEQQTATAEVLQIINSSAGNLLPVFNILLEKALSLCGASFGELRTYDGDRFFLAAAHGVPEAYTEYYSRHDTGRYGPGTGPSVILAGERLVHIPDLVATEPYQRGDPDRRAIVDLAGARAYVLVPLLSENAVRGFILIYRQEPRPFSDKQIALLQNFAAQAVVAMENARLITETREALDQQTATAEVLGVINSSPGNLAPVFDALLQKAMQLCEAAFGGLTAFDGERFHTLAVRGLPTTAVEAFREPWIAGPGTYHEDLVQGERLVHTDFGTPDPARQAHPQSRVIMEIGKARTGLIIALRKDERLIGSLFFYRQEVRPFSDKQIALLQNFAAQAVVAMENARLITETREALEQQTATAEVLGVINSSPGDLIPVFDAILEKAHRLCGATHGALGTYDDDYYFRSVTARGYPEALAERLRQGFDGLTNPVTRPLIDGARFVHIPDLADIDHPIPQAVARLGGFHTGLFLPLRKDDRLFGHISATRSEVRPFAEKEIALLQNFAAQAVIAMENARLITETREALEQQTATAEVLGVINSSPGNLQPVFDTMLEKATSLCEAASGHLYVCEGEAVRLVAAHGDLRLAEHIRQRGLFQPARGVSQDRVLHGEQVAHIVDAFEDEAYRTMPTFAQMSALDAVRTLISVALRKDDALLGILTIYRREVRPFTEKEITLLENFAAQAVIAMENARLIAETREALEQQTATAEVLGVINSSPGDLAPVFDAMLEKATRLCEAQTGHLLRYESGAFSRTASLGVSEDFDRVLPLHLPVPHIITRDSVPYRLFTTRSAINIADLREDASYRAGAPAETAAVEQHGVRSVLFVPLLKETEIIGCFVMHRSEVRPFSDRQIALLQNFAAQAVIAMENARLITETREALQQQTATAEVLGVINSSPGDLGPVFDAVLEKAMHLCGAAFGILNSYEGGRAETVATRGVPEAFINFRKDNPPEYGPGTGPARILSGERVVHIIDLKEEDAYLSGDPNRRAIVHLGGARTMLLIPLLKEDAILGQIGIYRRQVQPFSDKQIALLQSFAAQAVIAIENARLLNEIRQRQAELRVTFDNMGDGVVMFDEHLRLAAWNRNFQEMLDLPDALLGEQPSYADYLRLLADRGEFGAVDVEAELSRRLEHMDQEFRQERTRPDGRVIEVRRNAVPDGGFVLIYSDITERKRSEAEIRAARDAAEAAYHDLKAAQSNLIQAQKMAALGQLTAGIAHEIKNPLNFVNNFAGLSVELLDELKGTTAPAIEALDEDTRAEIDDTIEMLTGNLEKIVEHGQRADGIVRSMLDHSRGATSERRKVDLNTLVEEALNLAYHGARAQDQNFNITLERDYEKGLAEIDIVPQEVNRVFINLIGNGFYATAKRERGNGEAGFRPILKVSTRDLGEMVEVRIRDNGIGISAEIRDKLFQPFFTTKPTGEGTGLGLSISYDIVTQQHGGTIEVESEVGEFTEFTVRLPRAYRATAEAAS